MSAPSAPRKSTGILHRERLLPGPGGWAGVVGFAVVVGIALVPVAPAIGAVVAALVLVVLVVGVVAGSPVVVVADGELRAGAAHIPADLLDTPEVLDRAGVRAALGPGSDARTYACLRAWIPGAVLVRVTDPQDPTPAWLVSSRRPDVLASALRSAQAGSGRPGSGQAHSEQIG